MLGMSNKILYPLKFIALALNTVGNFTLAGDMIGKATNGAASLGVNGKALSSNLNNGLFAHYKPSTNEDNKQKQSEHDNMINTKVPELSQFRTDSTEEGSPVNIADGSPVTRESQFSQ